MGFGPRDGVGQYDLRRGFCLVCFFLIYVLGGVRRARGGAYSETNITRSGGGGGEGGGQRPGL